MVGGEVWGTPLEARVGFENETHPWERQTRGSWLGGEAMRSEADTGGPELKEQEAAPAPPPPASVGGQAQSTPGLQTGEGASARRVMLTVRSPLLMAALPPTWPGRRPPAHGPDRGGQGGGPTATL